MRIFSRLGAVSTLAFTVAVAFATPALAHTPDTPSSGFGGEHHGRGADHAVFVQTDDPAGNAVVAYHRANDGTLSLAGTYATGGNGGVLAGSVVDHLASQGSLTYDPNHSLLFAVNAGSNTVSVFAVDGDHLSLRQVLPSFGRFPVSVAVHGDLAYVLNAEAGASVHGFGIAFGHVFSIPGSTRPLGLDPNAAPQFVNTPGQVAFSPDGSQLIVTTKANGNDVDVFRVGFFGLLSGTPVVNALPGAVPFAVAFDPAQHLVVSEAGTNSLASFALHHNGTITPIGTAATGQAATCWVVGIGNVFYASNAGSASVSRIQSGATGSLSFLGNTTTDAGTVDAAASVHGDFLYVQTGANGIVDEYRVDSNGSLTAIGSVTVANAVGGEGIVAL